ncbi:diguanylate cyclase domain-containing protein [Marinimicrobium locisalis]|uniref:diguanylate cyclase domain-containing protein n=1 Tax=Marinimicrobium locisalis TaxID=546022 RepID=UPI003221AC88
MPQEQNFSSMMKQVPPQSRRPPNPPGMAKAPHHLSANVSFEDMALITLDAIGDAVLVIDPKGKVIYLNKVAETLTGWPSEEALGRAVGDIFFNVDRVTRQRAINPAHRAIKEGRTVALALGSVLIRRDGSDIAIEDSAAPVHNHRGKVVGAVIVFHDARQYGAVMQKMSHLAQHDALTGLPNRVFLMERLTHAIGMAQRRGRKMALLFLDLDYFKEINDSFGHTLGDQLLRKASDKISSCVRATDTVSRHGGDEFVVLLTEIKERQDAAHVAEKLLDEFTEPQVIDGHQLPLTLSIGISVYPESGDDADVLLQNADTAMYKAKEGGRNSYQFFC